MATINDRHKAALRPLALLATAGWMCFAPSGSLHAQEEPASGFDVAPVEGGSDLSGLAGTVTAPEVKAPAGAPKYFPPVYEQALRAPLPKRKWLTGGFPRNIRPYSTDPNPYGRLSSVLKGALQRVPTKDNAFFQSLGTNGRSCATCHQPPSAMSISKRNINARWNLTNGNDPLFAPIDGANCPDLVPESSTSGSLYGGSRGRGSNRKAAHSLLLDKGLIRVFLPLPLDRDFTLKVISDPTTCNNSEQWGFVKRDGQFVNDPKADAAARGRQRMISFFRRPLISSNLDFVTAASGGNPTRKIMWDGREPDLGQQARDATKGHAQAIPDVEGQPRTNPTDAEVAEMVAFERAFFSAQIRDREAGKLELLQPLADGGARKLSQQPVVAPPPGGGGQPVFDEYDGWATQAGSRKANARGSIARGQTIFNGGTLDGVAKTFNITNVAGLNGLLVPSGPPPAPLVPLPNPLPGASCGGCHSMTHSGSDSANASMHDIGIGGQSNSFNPPLGPPPAADLPIYEVSCDPGSSFKFPADGSRTTARTNDLGLAMHTGKCEDVGKRKPPQVRGLAAHEPFFADGSAKDIRAIVDFYVRRFNITSYTDQDKEDLAAFLAAL